MMLEKVRLYMERQHMSEWREPLWVAVSGGVDSMVLLHVLHALRHPVSVVHVDHGLRGAESDADHALVREQCEALKVPFHGMKVDVHERVEERHVSIQMAARELRYEVFHRLLEEGPGKLAMAHHQDDSIETLFIQMLQGMGSHGWRTIAPVSGPFIRPLMATSRAEIITHAQEMKIAFREDASNAGHKYLRNRVRHELLPMLETWRPGVRRSLARSVDLFREMDHITQEHLGSHLPLENTEDDVRMIPFSTILDHGTPRLMLHHLLRRHGFHPDRLEDILRAVQKGSTGARFTDGGTQVVVDRGHLILSPVTSEPPSWIITSMDEVPADLPMTITQVEPHEVDLSQGLSVAWLELERLQFPLHLRPWRTGDRMKPVGLKGRKLISDILIDAKVPRHAKSTTYVLESGGRIVWLVGHRIAAGHEPQEQGGVLLRMAWQG